MGRGFFVVNVAAEQRKQAASDRRNAEAAAKREANIAALEAVVAEMNSKFGPFNVETELGLDMLNCAVARATGKDLYQHRAQRLAV